MFFHPFRFPVPPHEQGCLERADRFQLSSKQGPLEGFSWGKGPVIAVVHGWAGRSSQYYQFIDALVAKGFQVVAVDAPAHGLSPGKRTDLLELAAAVEELQKKFGAFHAVVGHSLGGAAAMMAICNGVRTQRLITISTPSLAEEILGEFARRINGSDRVKDAIKAKIRNDYGREFLSLTASELARELPEMETLIVHDHNDREAAFEHALALKERLPHAKLMSTKGLGHTRILRDQAVVEAVTSFASNFTPELVA